MYLSGSVGFAVGFLGIGNFSEHSNSPPTHTQSNRTPRAAQDKMTVEQQQQQQPIKLANKVALITGGNSGSKRFSAGRMPC